MDRRRFLSHAGLAVAGMTAASARAADTPLRMVYLAGNPIQAFPDPVSGALKGPIVDMAGEFARRLGRPLELVPGKGVEGVLQTLRGGGADIGFVAYDPARAQGLEFSPPYLLSLNSYVVLASSPLRDQTMVDRVGITIGTNPGDAGGLYLQRTLTAAKLQGVTAPDAGRDLLLDGTINVFAANRQRLQDGFGNDPRFRILPGFYFGVPQTVVVRMGDPLLAFVSATVTDMLRSGFVQQAIVRAGLVGAQAVSPDVPR